MSEEVTEAPRNIALLSKTTLISESQMYQITSACGEQLRTEVAPRWNKLAPKVRFLEHDSEIPDGWWPIYGWEHTDAPGALGYHDLNPFGVPFASVFLSDILGRGRSMLKGKDSVSSVFSHECIEAFLNAFLNSWIEGPDGALWAVEGCDAVQADTYPITELGIEVSSFVYPSYFQKDASGPYDRLGKLVKPFSIDAGGYAIRKVDGEVKNIYGAEVPDWKREKHATSRTERIKRVT